MCVPRSPITPTGVSTVTDPGANWAILPEK